MPQTQSGSPLDTRRTESTVDALINRGLGAMPSRKRVNDGVTISRKTGNGLTLSKGWRDRIRTIPVSMGEAKRRVLEHLEKTIKAEDALAAEREQYGLYNLPPVHASVH